VNGLRLTEHTGGYTGFSLDVTGAVKTGATCWPCVSTTGGVRSSPRARANTSSAAGNLPRRAAGCDGSAARHLERHIRHHAAGLKGVRTVNVKTEIRNDSTAAKAVCAETAILDPDGKVVASLSSRQSVPAGTTVTFNQTTDPSPDETVAPRPSGALPGGERGFATARNWLIDLKPRLVSAGSSGTAGQGLFLNGEHYYFKGVNASGSRRAG